MTTSKVLWSLVLSGAVAVTAACGDSKSSMNPVAPSAVVLDGSQNAESGGVAGPQAKGGVPGPPADRGNGDDKGNNGKNPNNGGNPGQTPTNGSPGAPTAPGLKKVEIEGLISAKGGDSITVNGQKVIVPSTCPIRHGSTMFTFADLHIGDRVHVRADKVTTAGTGTGAASSTTLEATEVMKQNPGDVSDGTVPTSLVSVTATDALAGETGANTGTFTLTRSGDATLQAAPLTVTYTLAGTATNVVDYTTSGLPLSVTFPAGVATATVVVSPIADATTEGPETVILMLDVTTPYEVGSPASATVTISDTAAPLVSVIAFDSTAAEATLDPGVFRFSRAVVAATPLTVDYTLSGTASAGDYTPVLTGSVVIPAGQLFVDVTVTPVLDTDLTEIAELLTVTLVDGPAYDLQAPTTATVTITP